MTFEEYIESIKADEYITVCQCINGLSVEDYLTLGQEYGEYVQMCLLTPETPLI